MNIEPRFVIELKGKPVVLYAGLLDAAHRDGLRSLEVRLLQVPGPENGQLAIAEAVALFEDGRRYVEIGDAGPQNLSPSMAPAACRMAATRSKARALRDALNVAMCSFEEMPPEEKTLAGGFTPVESAPVTVTDPHEGGNCTQCGLILRPAQVAVSRQRTGGLTLCPQHQRAAAH